MSTTFSSRSVINYAMSVSDEDITPWSSDALPTKTISSEETSHNEEAAVVSITTSTDDRSSLSVANTNDTSTGVGATDSYYSVGVAASISPIVSRLSSSCDTILSAALSTRTLPKKILGKATPSLTGSCYNNQIAAKCKRKIGMIYQTSNKTAERRTEFWLQSQISEYRAALLRQNILKEEELNPTSQPSGAGFKSSSKELRKQKKSKVRRLKEELFDETVLQTQTSLLIQRIGMCNVSAFTSFPEYAQKRYRILTAEDKCSTTAAGASSYCSKNDDRFKFQLLSFRPEGQYERDSSQFEHCLVENERNQLYLRQKSLKERDALTISTLKNIEICSSLRNNLDGISKQCRYYVNENCALWNKVLDRKRRRCKDVSICTENSNELDVEPKEQRRAIDSSSNTVKAYAVLGCSGDTFEKRGRTKNYLKKETEILRQMLLNIIIHSGIEWYTDHRLHSTMLRLEND